MDNYSLNNPRRWLTDGASMVFSGWTRNLYWFINLMLYVLLIVYMVRVQTGAIPNLQGPYQSGALIPTLLSPLNIFEYPSYILIIALLTAMVCFVPILTAQFYNFFYSIPFLLVVFFLGQNPILTLALLISCLSVSFEPLRFKSKFVSAVLCLFPVLLYWGLFSGENPERDVLRWAVLYAPWGFAFLFCVLLFGIVIIIGHFLRYRPVVIMPIFGLTLAMTVLLFHHNIGLQERDFQAEVFQYSPEQVKEFQARSITGLLEQELVERQKQHPYLSSDLIANQLRAEWRWAFNSKVLSNINNPTDFSPSSLSRKTAVAFSGAWIESMGHIEKFLKSHPYDKRVADALYYQGLLLDMNVDARLLRDEDYLRFYHTVPSTHSAQLWQDILNRFGHTPMGIEARWRVAYLTATKKPKSLTEQYKFDEAYNLLKEAKILCKQAIGEQKDEAEKPSFWTSQLGAIFSKPSPTMGLDELADLQQRIGQLLLILDEENRTENLRNDERLATFISLDSHQLSYDTKLKELLLDAPQPDPLQDNIELAQSLLIDGKDDKIARLAELSERYAERDGGAMAMLAYAKLLLEERKNSEYRGDRQHLHKESRDLLQRVIASRPDTYLASEAQLLLEQNPLE